MFKIIKFYILPNKQVTCEVEYPNKCPICHLSINSGYVIHNYIPNKSQLQVIFMCPNEDCRSYFIGYNKYVESDNKLYLEKIEPVNYKENMFSDLIKNLSPTFLEIYNQASEAKGRNLFQISGPGFRKAFEFLIKDYAKSITDNNKHKEIEKQFSGKVVENFIKDTRIQKVAKRALWLGNDQTHYLRKWEEKDLNDLITLIKLTINWIEIEKLSLKYIEDMPE